MGEKGATIDRSLATVRSPISWALLGLVIQRPSYGYELVQRFERTYGDVLELSSPSQIYTALDSLSRRSLIEEVPPEAAPPGVIRQPKPHYEATDEGVRSYKDQLIAQLRDEGRRSHLFALQLALLSPKAALGLIERYERTYLTQTRSAPVARRAESPAGDSVGSLVARLVGEENRLKVEARLAWIDYARRELKALAGADTHGR
jgi:DNA-binding PadR family transcriptional regulator